MGLKIEVKKDSRSLNEEQVVRHLVADNTIVWTIAGELHGKQDDSCVDGREVKAIIGTPGGDIAILAEAIQGLSNATGRELKNQDIHNVLRWYTEKNGTFYHHTDMHGLEHLFKAINTDKNMPNFSEMKELIEFLKKPDQKYQTMLLNLLIDTNNIGCGHLKLMLLNPHAYGVTEKLMQELIKAFFDTLWNDFGGLGNKMDYRILEGEHTEGAVVNILIEEEKITDDTEIPMVVPNNGNDISIFVNHPQIALYQLKRLITSLSSHDLFEKDFDKKKLAEYINEVEAVHGAGTRETVSRLAWGLPIYNILVGKTEDKKKK